MKILVVYFSASHVTEKVAIQLAQALQADLEEIVPLSRYTEEDLDWRNYQSRSSIEMQDEDARPPVVFPTFDAEEYDFIFVGFPIWWGVEPRAVDSYLDNFDLTDKKIIPFATSGSSTIEKSIEHLRDNFPEADVKDGFLLNGPIDIEKIKEALN